MPVDPGKLRLRSHRAREPRIAVVRSVGEFLAPGSQVIMPCAPMSLRTAMLSSAYFMRRVRHFASPSGVVEVHVLRVDEPAARIALRMGLRSRQNKAPIGRRSRQSSVNGKLSANARTMSVAMEARNPLFRIAA